MKCSIVIWILIQIVLIVIYWDVSQRSDQGAYIRMATECYERGIWYPNVSDVYSKYIWAPGLINFFILQLKFFGTLKMNYVINLLMNIAILYNVWYLAKKFFSIRTAQIATIFFCLMHSNIMIVLPAGTEIPFLFLSISAFSLVTSKKNIGYIILASVMLTLANWIRPLVVAFLPVMLIFMLVKKYKIIHYASLLIPMVLLICVIGFATKQSLGYFNFQSTTSGFNLIMTANDKAYGGVSTSLAGDTTSTVYLKDESKYTFMEKDSIWKTRSIEWIKEHPIKFAGLYVVKLAGLHIEDSWSERPILGGDGFVDKAAHGKADKIAILKRIWNMFSKSIVYYIILLLSVIAIVKYRKELWSDKGYIILIWLLGTLITCIFSVSPRYHYPFMFALIIWAAYGVDKHMINKTKKKNLQ